MKYLTLILLLLVFISCDKSKSSKNSIIFSGTTPIECEYVIIKNDTIKINKGLFVDTILNDKSIYDYVQLSTWKWPKLIYLENDKNLHVDFTEASIEVKNDRLNNFLLNSDSILHSYSLNWNMENKVFRESLAKELESNFNIIDSVFSEKEIDNWVVSELKSIEKLKVAHRTANFISFQERKENSIDRDIYDFISDVNLNNERLENQVNNRNFQYYYLIDKVNKDVPDADYPFAVIDTVNKYSSLKSIRKMIITSTVTSSFYNEDVDHEKLISIYEGNFGKLNEQSDLYLLKEKIDKLKPGNKAPGFGKLPNINNVETTLEDLEGQNILLTVWGTWCPHCRKELPALRNLINSYGDKFTSVGISFDTDADKWNAYIKENKWEGIHLLDSKRKSEFKSNYLINGTNVHLLIDKNGIIVSSKEWKPSSPELEDLIKSLD